MFFCMVAPFILFIYYLFILRWESHSIALVGLELKEIRLPLPSAGIVCATTSSPCSF